MTTTDSWTEQLRAAALELARIAAEKHRGTGRALRHLVTGAIAHGVTPDELVAVTDLNRDELIALADPGADLTPPPGRWSA